MVSAIVLAGGKGARMNGFQPKVLYKVGGKPILYWTLNLLEKLKITQKIIVVGYKYEVVIEKVSEMGFKTDFARQRKPLGTGNAVKSALKYIQKGTTDVLVIYGDDSSLYRKETIAKLLDTHIRKNSMLTILTTLKQGISLLGGLQRDNNGRVVGVLSSNELIQYGCKETEILCGVFCFNKLWLEKNIYKIKKGKIKGEYPLPVLIELAAIQGFYSNTVRITNSREWNSVNTMFELNQARIKRAKMN